MWRRWFGIGLLWFCAPLYALVVRIGLTAVSPHDYWWPIVQGRAAERLGEIPDSNLFLFTMEQSAAFFNQPWLAQRFMWQIHAWGGVSWGVYTNALLVCSAFLVLLWGSRQLGASMRLNAVMAMLAAIFASSGMSVRTQMFAVPCFAATYMSLFLFSRYGFARWRYLLVLLVAVPLWANVHGSFILATLMAGGFGLGKCLEVHGLRYRVEVAGVWGALIAVIVGLSCVTPHGVDVFLYVLDLQSKMGGGANVSEWAPMAFEGEGLLFYGAAIVSGVCALFWRRHVGLGPLIVMAGLLWLAVTGRRNLIWWAMSSQVILAVGGTYWWRMKRGVKAKVETTRTAETFINLVLCVVLWAGAVSCLPGGRAFKVLTADVPAEEGELKDASLHLPYVGYEALNREHPLKTLKMLGDRVKAGEKIRLFHAQSIGGVVEYAMATPERRDVAFVDQRFELIPMEVWQDYARVEGGLEGYEDVLVRHEITHMLVDRRGAGGLIAKLSEGNAWCEVGDELEFVLYARCGR